MCLSHSQRTHLVLHDILHIDAISTLGHRLKKLYFVVRDGVSRFTCQFGSKISYLYHRNMKDSPQWIFILLCPFSHREMNPVHFLLPSQSEPFFSPYSFPSSTVFILVLCLLIRSRPSSAL